jgi:hypothetical protein
MLFKMWNTEVAFNRSLIGFTLFPRWAVFKNTFCFNWLGGNIVWSRLKRTLKDINRVQED